MCGIAGIIGSRHLHAERIQQSLLHRGPDEQQAYRYKEVTLIHTRLAIQDIAHGQQPMHLGPYTIIFNGEIYNHLELREHCDHSFTTNSDAETLLYLYATHKHKCLDMLDGMFAFAVLDKDQDTVFMARDRAGKKPLYYYHADGSIVFASELNAVKTAVDLQVDEKRIFLYLRLCSFYRRQTPYRNVKELEAGSWALIKLDAERIDTQRWWNICDVYAHPLDIDDNDACSAVEAHLKTGVQRRLENSDLEVGAFLSGGIDSTLITAMAAGMRARLRTFTVSFEGSYDESGLAKLVADRYSTDHTALSIDYRQLTDDIENILNCYGEPFADSSAIPSYYVSREARKHLTVILNGDGADELFGGYRRYVPFSWFDFFSPRSTGRNFLRALSKRLPPPHDKKQYYNYLYRLVDLAAKDGLGCYLSATTDIFEGLEHRFVSTDGYAADIESDLGVLIDSRLTGLQKIMNMDFDTLLAGNLLVKMDIATMSNSLEGRSPFLCKELLEFAPRLPDRQKIRLGTTKYLLRKLATRYLPPELIDQPKRGFEVPLKKWMDQELKEMVFDYLGTNCYASQFFTPGFIPAVLNRREQMSDEKRAKILWTLLALEIWNRHDRRLRNPSRVS